MYLTTNRWSASDRCLQLWQLVIINLNPCRGVIRVMDSSAQVQPSLRSLVLSRRSFQHVIPRTDATAVWARPRVDDETEPRECKIGCAQAKSHRSSWNLHPIYEWHPLIGWDQQHHLSVTRSSHSISLDQAHETTKQLILKSSTGLSTTNHSYATLLKSRVKPHELLSSWQLRILRMLPAIKQQVKSLKTCWKFSAWFWTVLDDLTTN